MRVSLRAVVQTEYALNDIVQIGRKLHGAGAAAIFSVGMLILLEHHAEGITHGSHSAGEDDGPARRTGFHHCESVVAGKSLDTGNIGRIGPVALLILSAAEGRAFLW